MSATPHPAGGAGYTVRLISTSKRAVDPAVKLPAAQPVRLPFAAYKHLLSGKPYIRPRRPGGPETGG